VTPPLPDLVLYGRAGCHLCEEAAEAARLVIRDREGRGLPVPRLVERDIEADPELHRAYIERIPVVEIGGRRLELLVTASKLARLVAGALDAPVG